MFLRHSPVALRTSFRALLAALLAVFLLQPGSDVLAAQDASAFLAEFTDRAIGRLTEPGVAPEEKDRRFRRLVNEGMDMRAISKFMLGRYWEGASAEERSAFQATFEDLLARRFLPLFDEYSGEKIEVGFANPFKNNPDFFNVSSALRRAEGEPIPIGWRVRRIGEGYKIVDIVAEGVSIAVTLRSEYTSVLKTNGGSVSDLIRVLKAKIEGL